MEYTVYGTFDDSFDNEWEIRGLTESEARKEANDRATGPEKVFVGFYRRSNSQIGYLNRDGHSPNGKAW